MYKSKIIQHSSYAAAFTNVTDFLESIGWVLHDSYDIYKVYKSDSEAGIYNMVYMRLHLDDKYLYLRPYLYWDASTHTGTCYIYYGESAERLILTTTAGKNWMYMYGSRDFVLLHAGNQSDNGNYNYVKCFGFLKGIKTTVALLTSDALAGDYVTLNVDQTDGFIENCFYQLVGVNTEGRDKVFVTNILDATSMIVENLPRDYASGAKIGVNPCPFGSSSAFQIATLVPLCGHDNVGIENINDGNTLIALASPICSQDGSNSVTHGDPDDRTQRHILSPMFYGEGDLGANVSDTVFGHILEPNILRGPFRVSLEIYVNNYQVYGVSDIDFPHGVVTFATNTTIVDNSKSWAINEWQDKFVVIVEGAGLNQTRRILSNTSNELTVSEWIVNPNTTSQFYIMDEAFREIGYLLCKEDI